MTNLTITIITTNIALNRLQSKKKKLEMQLLKVQFFQKPLDVHLRRAGLERTRGEVYVGMDGASEAASMSHANQLIICQFILRVSVAF